MRTDMAKVIVERPRRFGRSGGERKGRSVPLDQLPSHEGMARPHVLRGTEKSLNENLSPLRRYLARQVGRPWRKVFAEIAANLRVDSTVQQHVRDHVRQYVAVDPRRGTSIFGLVLPNGLWFEAFYVDPEDGLLKRTADLPELRHAVRRDAAGRRAPRPVTRVVLGPDRELRQAEGIWYEVALARLPDPVYREERTLRRIALKPHRCGSPEVETEVVSRRLVTPPVRDALTGAMVFAGPLEHTADGWYRFNLRNRDRRYVASKRQLDRRALRRHGLVNAAEEPSAR